MPSSRPHSSFPHESFPPLPILTSLAEEVSPVPESKGEVEQDQLTFTIDSPSCPHFQLFENIFNTGKPLAGYCQDDPLWSLLVAVASPCTNCVKAPHNCKVLPNSPHCTNCSAKKTCSLVIGSWSSMELLCIMRHGVFLSKLGSNANAVDQQELRMYLALQQEKAAIAAKRKRNRSPSPVAGPSHKKTTGSEVPKRRPCCKHLTVEASSEPAPCVRLVIPPGRSVVVPPTIVPCASPSPMEVPSRDEPLQGPAGLVQLAAAAEAQSGVVQRFVSPLQATTPIKGTG
ncbi:hypothetical protein F5879DRAFT_994163 [Lentinula edodes]|nr:hypothetical protein F5879DRAFT_994163 [Lentinula edodes]